MKITIGTSVYNSIKDDIVFGVLKPSTKLKLAELKEKYNISVSTLREALNRLSSDGFVLAQEQRGFYVAPISKKDFIEISKLRVLIESYALEESIKNASTDWESNLVAMHYKLNSLESNLDFKNEEKKQQWKEFDRAFHQALISACNSDNLLLMHSIVYDKFVRYQMLILTFRGNQAVKEHDTLLKAALSKDILLAKKILKEHILLGLEHCLENNSSPYKL